MKTEFGMVKDAKKWKGAMGCGYGDWVWFGNG